MAHGDDNEAWRGDQPPDQPPERPRGGIFGMFESRALTPEEKEAVRQHIAERRAAAAVRALVLSAFTPDATCIKCGWYKVKVLYCPGGTDDNRVGLSCFADTAGQEHLHRQCKRCGYEWHEKTLDVEKSAIRA